MENQGIAMWKFRWKQLELYFRNCGNGNRLKPSAIRTGFR